MATKLYSSFFFSPSACERHYSARRNVRSGLIELTIRQWHAEKREAHRGVVVRQSGRPASHAYGAFHYIKPFQCIIYFCVSHLRYGLCTGDGGQRALCNIADLKIAAWQRLDSAALGIHYPHVRFFTEVLLPSHLYCDKPFLHSGRPSLAACPARCECATSHFASPEENICMYARARAEMHKSLPLPLEARRRGNEEILKIYPRAGIPYFYASKT